MTRPETEPTIGQDPSGEEKVEQSPKLEEGEELMLEGERPKAAERALTARYEGHLRELTDEHKQLQQERGRLAEEYRAKLAAISQREREIQEEKKAVIAKWQEEKEKLEK